MKARIHKSLFVWRKTADIDIYRVNPTPSMALQIVRLFCSQGLVFVNLCGLNTKCELYDKFSHCKPRNVIVLEEENTTYGDITIESTPDDLAAILDEAYLWEPEIICIRTLKENITRAQFFEKNGKHCALELAYFGLLDFGLTIMFDEYQTNIVFNTEKYDSREKLVSIKQLFKTL